MLKNISKVKCTDFLLKDNIMTKKEQQYDLFNSVLIQILKDANKDIKAGDNIDEVFADLKFELRLIYKKSQEGI